MAAGVAVADDGDVQIFRVIVRGRFGPLEPATREALWTAAGDHDIVTAGATFTAAGTLSYDTRLDFFSYRIEVRVPDDEADGPDGPDPARAVAFERATAIAAADLERRRLPWRQLSPTGSNMADIWN